MKKTCFFYLIALSLTAPVHAQFVLTEAECQYDITGSPDVDSIYSLSTNFTRPTLGAGQNWDFSSVPVSFNSYYRHYIPDADAFPGTTLMRWAFTPISQLEYVHLGQQTVTTEGRFEHGVHIRRQALPIGAITNTPTDSLIFPKQSAYYSAPERLLVFPTELGDTWADTFQFTTDFSLTVGGFGLFNAPGQRKAYRTIQYEVVASGNMVVRNTSGSPSAAHPVICVRYQVHNVDSFFLAGQPAPALLLGAFGLQQGMVGNVYEELFYRADEPTPLMGIGYTDANYTVINEAFTHHERVGMLSNTGETTVLTNVLLGPNPVAAGEMLQVTVDQAAGKVYEFTLTDALGRRVLQTQFSSSGAIAIPADMSVGMYYYQVVNTDANAATSGVLMVR
jgi:hypothetical protein